MFEPIFLFTYILRDYKNNKKLFFFTNKNYLKLFKVDTVGGPAPSAPSEPSERSVPGSTGIWRESVAGMVPSDAVEGGRDIDGPLYVGRAHHEGALIPGKVNPQHSACYIAWGGVEHGKQQYEVK